MATQQNIDGKIVIDVSIDEDGALSRPGGGRQPGMGGTPPGAPRRGDLREVMGRYGERDKMAQQQQGLFAQFLGKGSPIGKASIGSLAKLGSVVGLLFMALQNSKVIGTVMSTIGTLLGSLVDVILAPAVPLIVGFLRVIAKVIEVLARIWNWDNLVAVFKNVAAFLIKIVTGTWDNLKKLAAGVWEGIGEYVKGLWKVLVGIFTLDWDKVIEGGKQMWNGIKIIASAVWNYVKDQAKLMWDAVVELTRPVWTAIKDAAIGIWDSVKAYVLWIWDTILWGLKNAVNAMVPFADPFGNVGPQPTLGGPQQTNNITVNVAPYRLEGASPREQAEMIADEIARGNFTKVNQRP